VKHTHNLNRVSSGCDEEESVVANTEPKFFSARESLYVAFAGFREPMQGAENMPWVYPGGGRRLWMVPSKRSASHRFHEPLDFFLRDTKLSQDPFMRDTLVVSRPFASFIKCLSLFRGNGLVIDRSIGECARYRIENCFQQANDGRGLLWRQPIDQFMRSSLFVVAVPFHL